MVFIPLSDEAPERRHEPPYVTYAIIALNVLVFLWRASVSSGEDVAFSPEIFLRPVAVADDQCLHLMYLIRFPALPETFAWRALGG